MGILSMKVKIYKDMQNTILTPVVPQYSVEGKAEVRPIAIMGALFFIFGLFTWMNSVLIPYLQIACELNAFESYMVALSFYISYLFMAIPSSWMLKAIGFKKGMALGLVVMAIGSLVFIPAALSRTYLLFLAGLFIQGSGLALLHTASNPYITILGPAESAAKRISVIGICYKVAGAIAPIVLGAIALKDADQLTVRLKNMDVIQRMAELNELASSVIAPYVVIIIALMVLAVLIYISSLPEIDTDIEDEKIATANEGKCSVLQFPHLLLGVFSMFLYVGVEAIAGESIIRYGASQGVSLPTARFFTTCTITCMIAGYVVGIICIPKYLSQHKALRISAVLGILLALAAVSTHGFTSVLCIALLGVANSLIWPALWPLCIAGLGRFTRIGSSLLIMAISGGALLPLVYGQLAVVFNLQQAYLIFIPCYAFIWFYSVKGFKLR
jgi:glucose/galactose transporter